MKKNWFLRIGLIALVLTVATSCLVGGTFAKYTTSVSGADTIQVARFGFTATDGTIALTTDTAHINLFKDVATDATGTVAQVDDSLMFAPGVYGTFAIELDNRTTDVDVAVESTVTVAILVKNEDLEDVDLVSDDFKADTAFIKFAISDTAFDGTIPYGAVSSLNQFKAAVEGALTIAPIDPIEKNTRKTIYVAYIWDSGSDTLDTKIGGVALAKNPLTISVTIAITASQIID